MSRALAITGQLEMVRYDLDEFFSRPCPLNNIHAKALFTLQISILDRSEIRALSRRLKWRHPAGPAVVLANLSNRGWTGSWYDLYFLPAVDVCNGPSIRDGP